MLRALIQRGMDVCQAEYNSGNITEHKDRNRKLKEIRPTNEISSHESCWTFQVQRIRTGVFRSPMVELRREACLFLQLKTLKETIRLSVNYNKLPEEVKAGNPYYDGRWKDPSLRFYRHKVRS
jgi:pyruvate kinase